MVFLRGLLGGVWGYVGAAALGAAVVTGALYYTVALPYQLTISKMETAAAESKALDATAALARYQQFINNVDTAAREYGKSKEAMLFEFATLKRDLLNAFKATPLPVDCRPDVARVQSLDAAIDAANTAPSSHGIGETVRTTPEAGSP
jgi:hypothetical protein